MQVIRDVGLPPPSTHAAPPVPPAAPNPAGVAEGLPTRIQLSADVHKWITRERPKIDRIACPWLIRRFIDPDAEFICVAADRVLDPGKALSAIPYDIPDVEFTHLTWEPACRQQSRSSGAWVCFCLA
jgi:hypothetical protein